MGMTMFGILTKQMRKGNPKKESLSGTPTQFRGSRRNYRSGTTTVRWAIIIAALAHVVSATTESIRLSKREAAYYEPCRLNPLWPDRTRVEGDTNASPVQATVHAEPKKIVDPEPKSPETPVSRKTSQAVPVVVPKPRKKVRVVNHKNEATWKFTRKKKVEPKKKVAEPKSPETPVSKNQLRKKSPPRPTSQALKIDFKALLRKKKVQGKPVVNHKNEEPKPRKEKVRRKTSAGTKTEEKPKSSS